MEENTIRDNILATVIITINCLKVKAPFIIPKLNLIGLSTCSCSSILCLC